MAVAAALLTAMQVQAGLDENRAFALAARQATDIGAIAVGGGPRHAFSTNAQQDALMLEIRALKLESASADTRAGAEPPEPVSAERQLAAADRATAHRLRHLTANMATVPTAADGVDDFTRAVAQGSQADLRERVVGQQASAAAAQRAGNRANLLVVALFAITIAVIAVEISTTALTVRWRRRLTAAGFTATAVTAVLVVATYLT